MALFKSKFRRILRFGTLVLWYFTLVGHTKSKVGHLKSVILKVDGRSYRTGHDLASFKLN